jgi:hypothetical protein
MTPMLITVFGLFLSDPTREYHEREVVRAEKRSKGSADKVLHVLAAQGFFSISRRLTAIRLFSLPCVSMRRLCSKALLERSAQYVARDIDELPSVCGTGCGSDLFPIQNLHPQTGTHDPRRPHASTRSRNTNTTRNELMVRPDQASCKRSI